MTTPPERGPRPYAGWDWLWRGSFGVDHAGHRYDIEADYFDWDERIWLYVDGERREVAKSRAAWPLENGDTLEARMQTYGMSRARIRRADGTIIPLEAVAGSGEHWRQRMATERPELHRALSRGSLAVLLVSLALAVPQWLAGLLGVVGIDWTPWFELPGWATGAVTALAVVAGIERALRLQTDSFE